MSNVILSKRKADAISNGVFLIGLGVLFYTNAWWPGILIILWVALALRQFLTGRNYDAVLSTIILIGLFLISYVKVDWSILVPVLFVIGGIYLIFKEYFYADETIDQKNIDQLDDINDRK
jgi:hypothetical protein